MPQSCRRARVGVHTLLFALLFCLTAQPGGAVPVSAEARVHAAGGDVHGAAGAAAQRALVEAVRVVLRRHVSSADLVDRSDTVRKTVLERAPRFVLRYSIADERWDDLTVVVRVEAEVDRDRILASLRAAGVPVSELAVKPRLLLVALEPSAEAALVPLARVLEAVGYPPRIGARPVDQAVGAVVDEARVGRWARAAGCHLALVVEAARGGGLGDVASVPAEPPAWPGGLWFDPGEEPERAALPLVAWLADPSGRLPLGRLEALGEGLGTDRAEAEGMAAEAAGRQLGYGVLELLEQSAWAPEGVLSLLQVSVSGLEDPLLVEEIGAALATVPEVRRVQLAEVSSRRAAWRLEVVDAGLDWAAVLSNARLPRGGLAWDVPDVPSSPEPRAAGGATVPVLAARWQGP